MPAGKHELKGAVPWGAEQRNRIVTQAAAILRADPFYTTILLPALATAAFLQIEQGPRRGCLARPTLPTRGGTESPP